MPDFFAELRKTAARWPASLAFTSLSGNLDYSSLIQNIENIADNAAAHGLAEGSVACVACANPEVLLLAMLGLMRAGVTVGAQRETPAYLEAGLVPDVVLFDRAESRPKDLKAKRWLPLSPDWFQVRAGKVARPKRPSYALIVGSSGSTGRVKLIHADRANIEYRIESKFSDPYFEGRIRHLSTAGSMSMTTLVDYMITLMKGGLIIRSPHRSGRAVLDASSIYQPSYVSMAPLTLVDVVRTLSKSPRQIRKVDHLRLTGAYCSAALREQAGVAYAENVITSYGATEIGRVAWASFGDTGGVSGDVGKIIPGLAVETIDENGKLLPAGTEGELRIRPPQAAATRYVSQGVASNILTDDWFYPGDIGRVTPDGHLVITGRKSLVINLGGNKI
jgi:acyl-CoA synthetase (AMP-forming)/AMP-acid ligase II